MYGSHDDMQHGNIQLTETYRRSDISHIVSLRNENTRSIQELTFNNVPKNLGFIQMFIQLTFI